MRHRCTAWKPRALICQHGFLTGGSLFLFGNTSSVSTVGPNFRLPFNAVRFTIRNTGLEFFFHESVFPGPQRQCCGNLLMAPQSVAACLPSAGL
jgi:hypothetical protein